MRLSSKGRYAVSAMLHLAMHNSVGPVPLAEISDCQGISMSYVDQIFARLRRAELVVGIPGPGGGYRLARPAESISMGDIFAAVEESVPAGKRDGTKLDDVLWADLGDQIGGFLNQLSLSDLVERPGIREALRRQYRQSPWRCDVCGALSSRSPESGRSARH